MAGLGHTASNDLYRMWRENHHDANLLEARNMISHVLRSGTVRRELSSSGVPSSEPQLAVNAVN